MEYSVITLMAFILLIVFAGFQMQKLFNLFRNVNDHKSISVPTVKTVVKAEVFPEKKKKSVQKSKKVAKKAKSKK